MSSRTAAAAEHGEARAQPKTSRAAASTAKRPGNPRPLPSLRTHLLVTVPILTALLIVLVGGYVMHWSWTGYRGQEGARTLWDWLEMCVMPLTLALIPVWLKSRDRHGRKWAVAAAAGGTVLVVLAIGSYALDWRWTGFTEYRLWDWLKLFAVPFLLPLAFYFLSDDDKRRSARSARKGTGSSSVDWTRGALSPDGVAVWVGAVAVVACVTLVAALLAVGGPRHATAAEASRATTAGLGSLTREATVDSQDPAWTDTGVRLVPGERVSIVAVGMVLPSHRPGYHYVSPAGLAKPHPGQLSIDTRINHAALVATITPHRPSPLSSTSPDQLLAVGTGRTLTVRSKGELFLGLNDKKTSDNTGWFGATITVRPGRR